MDVYDRRLRWPVPDGIEARMAGTTIDRVDRRSKYLLFRARQRSLLVHLGMTGSPRVWRSPPPRKTHDHVDITLDDGTVLRYRDPRRFGAMLWIPAAPANRVSKTRAAKLVASVRAVLGARSTFHCPHCQPR